MTAHELPSTSLNVSLTEHFSGTTESMEVAGHADATEATEATDATDAPYAPEQPESNAASPATKGFPIAYGLLGLPLAMSALPVYVQVPMYYSSQLGLALASVGWVLFLARFIDALQDPLLGRVIDRLHAKLSSWFYAAGALLSMAMFGLWLPLVSSTFLVWWLAGMLILAYLAHSMLNIAYLSWGARIAASGAGSTGSLLGAAAWREGAGLLGVILASVIPSVIMAAEPSQIATRMAWYCGAFALILMLSISALLFLAPAWQRSVVIQENWRVEWRLMLLNRGFKALLLPYFLNAVSVSVPATLVLFFISDQLQAPTYSAVFLASYFIAAAIGLPCWVQLAKKIGVIASWRIGMLLAVVAFTCAGMLDAGEIGPFIMICIASGLALGADLALPPVLLARVIHPDAPPAVYYGIWTLLAKFALALSGLTLPLLAMFNYHPGMPANAALSWAYAGIPCVVKISAFLLLLRFPVILEGDAP